jgi:hypothetical protein
MKSSRNLTELPMGHPASSLVPLKMACYDCIHNATGMAMSEACAHNRAENIEVML